MSVRTVCERETANATDESGGRLTRVEDGFLGSVFREGDVDGVESNLFSCLFLHANIGCRILALADENDGEARDDASLALHRLDVDGDLLADGRGDGVSVDDHWKVEECRSARLRASEDRFERVRTRVAKERRNGSNVKV